MCMLIFLSPSTLAVYYGIKSPAVQSTVNKRLHHHHRYKVFAILDSRFVQPRDIIDDLKPAKYPLGLWPMTKS